MLLLVFFLLHAFKWFKFMVEQPALKDLLRLLFASQHTLCLTIFLLSSHSLMARGGT